MDITLYHDRANATLAACAAALEPAFEDGTLDELDLQGDILTIIPARSGRTYLLTKHAASQQVWLASPITGGLHFRWEETTQTWRLNDGETVTQRLQRELQAEGVSVTL